MPVEPSLGSSATPSAPRSPTRTEFLAVLRPILPLREIWALACWLTTFFLWQIEFLLDFSGASILVKSRRIGGSHALAAKAAMWTVFFGEDTYLVSVGEREAAALLAQVEKHCRVLARLGSRWALPARTKYVNDLALRTASGGVCTALPASSAGRSFGGNVILDEMAYMANPEAVWDAAAAATLLGWKLCGASTPNGPGNLFHQLVQDTSSGFRHFSVTLEQARAQGLKVSDRKIRQIDRGIPALHQQLFCCSFIARGNSLFTGVKHYTVLPTSYRVAIGLDLSYSGKTHSDYCAAVVLFESNGLYYVVQVIRERTTNFAPFIRQLHAMYPSAYFHWHVMASETGLGTNLRVEQGLPVLTHAAKADKFTRALPAAQAWNEGRIQVPHDAPWLAAFVAEVTTFTGEQTKVRSHDDQVDALASGFSALEEGGGVVTGGTPQIIPSGFGHVPQRVSAAGAYSPGSNVPQLIR